MTASAIASPDLGLDLRKVPDLTDAGTRKRLSSSAIVAFFALAHKWDLKSNDAMALLEGVSSGRYFELKRQCNGQFDQDQVASVVFSRVTVLRLKHSLN